MQTAYKLHGVHRHYDWGGTQYIPQLMQLKNDQNKPFAEYWMGAHASAPAIIDTDQFGSIALDQLLQKDKSLGNLPYLYKILDVAKAICPDCEHKIVGIRPGEKIHEEMITASDSYNTYDLGKYYVIIPTVPNWNIEDFKSYFSAKKVENGFNYSSGQNTEWESVDSLRKLIQNFIVTQSD